MGIFMIVTGVIAHGYFVGLEFSHENQAGSIPALQVVSRTLITLPALPTAVPALPAVPPASLPN